MNAAPLAQRAAQLRRDFDRAFAEAPRERKLASTDLLAIGLRGDPYALPLSAVAGLFADKKLTRLPCAAPEFLGIAGFRGRVVPVYDLRVLLGYPGGDTPRWLVVAAKTPVALAFDTLDGYLRLPTERIAQQQHGEAARPHVRELARIAERSAPADGALLRPIVDLACVAAAIRQRARRDIASPQAHRQE